MGKGKRRLRFGVFVGNIFETAIFQKTQNVLKTNKTPFLRLPLHPHKYYSVYLIL